MLYAAFMKPILAAVACMLCVANHANSIWFSTSLNGAAEVPPNGSSGAGLIAAVYDEASSRLSVAGVFAGLTAPATAGHVHVGATGHNGPVQVPLTFDPLGSGLAYGSAILTPSQAAELELGNWYVNIHDATFPGGEVRGQLTQGIGSSVPVLTQAGLTLFSASLNGAAEVPPNGSSGAGLIAAVYDEASSRLSVAGVFGGLSAPATAGHVHVGATGHNGPVQVPLSVEFGTSGFAYGSAILSPTQAAELELGNLYVNIHDSTFPGGEIRGQLLASSVGVPEGAGSTAILSLIALSHLVLIHGWLQRTRAARVIVP